MILLPILLIALLTTAICIYRIEVWMCKKDYERKALYYKQYGRRLKSKSSLK